MNWRRKLWGVEFRGSIKDDKPMLLGSLWHQLECNRDHYYGEPTRALVFSTREAARAWCRDQMRRYHGSNNVCAAWKFRPVRVLEKVQTI